MISLVIPTYILTKELEDITIQCIDSYRDQADEIIVSEDGGWFSPAILSKVDKYIYNKVNQGFVKNVNNAWKLTKHDYVAIVNNDTYLRKGNLEDLCFDGHITCPMTKGEVVPNLAGHFFMVPKVFGTALLNEELHTFCSDADLERRYPGAIVQIPSVEIWHEGNLTINTAGLNTGKQLEKDRKIYENICNNTHN